MQKCRQALSQWVEIQSVKILRGQRPIGDSEIRDGTACFKFLLGFVLVAFFYRWHYQPNQKQRGANNQSRVVGRCRGTTIRKHILPVFPSIFRAEQCISSPHYPSVFWINESDAAQVLHLTADLT